MAVVSEFSDLYPCDHSLLHSPIYFPEMYRKTCDREDFSYSRKLFFWNIFIGTGVSFCDKTGIFLFTAIYFHFAGVSYLDSWCMSFGVRGDCDYEKGPIFEKISIT